MDAALSSTYPTRPVLFVIHYLRALMVSGAGAEVGADGIALLTAVAVAEDALRYRRAPDFWCAQLLAEIGLRSWDSLDRCRRRCVAAGWLHYASGGRRRPGRYWVTTPAAVADDPSMIRTGADNGEDNAADQARAEDGQAESLPVDDPHRRGQTTDHSPDDQGSIRAGADKPRVHHSYPNPLRPSPLPDDSFAALLDPVKQSDPRGTGNDTPQPAPSEASPEQSPEARLGLWVRWRVSDQARTDENRATLRTLAARYGLPRVLAAAERLVFAGGPQREPGSKCWPDELLPALIALDAPQSPTRNAGVPVAPAVVRAARDLLDQHGDAACRAALGWAPTVAATHEALRSALDREVVAQALVDHFTTATAGAAT